MRKDLELIAALITPGSKVLDIGCAEGELLDYLVTEKQVEGQGIEISQSGVSICVKKGLPVIQGNADSDLIHYQDQGFDYAVMSRALQATHNPKNVLNQMGRIAKQVIVSVPNFGYWYNRFYLGLRGNMPVSKTLSYQWYETPNIHFSTVSDFKKLVKELGFSIEREQFILAENVILPKWAYFSANIIAEYAVFSLTRLPA